MTGRESQTGADVQDVRLAEAVRQACVKAALAAYESAAMDGLCQEGAWEVAVGAMKALDVARIAQEVREKENR